MAFDDQCTSLRTAGARTAASKESCKLQKRLQPQASVVGVKVPQCVARTRTYRTDATTALRAAISARCNRQGVVVKVEADAALIGKNSIIAALLGARKELSRTAARDFAFPDYAPRCN
eukprot:7381252-Prymnesium_polylepis.1